MWIETGEWQFKGNTDEGHPAPPWRDLRRVESTLLVLTADHSFGRISESGRVPSGPVGRLPSLNFGNHPGISLQEYIVGMVAFYGCQVVMNLIGKRGIRVG